MAQKPKPTSRPPRSRKSPTQERDSKSQDQSQDQSHDSQEMQASGEIQIGKYINLKGTARVTPAGVICAGMAGVAILAAATVLVYVSRRDT